MKKKHIVIFFTLIFFFYGFKKELIKNLPVDVPKDDSIEQQVIVYDTIKVPEYDSAYESKVITVIQLYWTSEFNLDECRRVIKSEGYRYKGWKEIPPTPEELKEALSVSNQLWIISDYERKLLPEHIEIIKEFFEAGHGVYLLGDNADYYTEVNFIGNVLVNATLYGDFDGEKKIMFPDSYKTDTIDIQRNTQYPKGKLIEHELTEGLNHLYEGISVSSLSPKAGKMNPVVYGSNGETLICTYEEDNKRLILDGGFTRLYNNWDTETAKYVKNAVMWLANTPRFESENITVVIDDELSFYAEQNITEAERTPDRN